MHISKMVATAILEKNNVLLSVRKGHVISFFYVNFHDKCLTPSFISRSCSCRGRGPSVVVSTAAFRRFGETKMFPLVKLSIVGSFTIQLITYSDIIFSRIPARFK